MFLLYGTFGSPIEATKEIQEMCNIVKEQAEFNTHKKYEEFRAVQYRIQVVSGTNYLIKVHVGGEQYLHVMVFQGSPCYGGALLLTRVQDGYKTRDEPLIPYPD